MVNSLSPPSDSSRPAARRRVEARLAAGMTRKQLAKKLGRKESYVAKLEGRGNMSYGLAQAWSRHIGCRIEILL